MDAPSWNSVEPYCAKEICPLLRFSKDFIFYDIKEIVMSSLFSLIIVLFPLSFYSPPIYATPSSEMESPTLAGSPSNCITFDSEERIITITCKTSNLSQIDSQLKNPDVLRRDGIADKGWILNAGLTVDSKCRSLY